MKKFLILLLAVMMTLSLVACGEGNNDASSQGEELSRGISNESIDFVREPVINGNSIDNYRIVYAETNDTAKFYTAAEALKTYIKNTFNVELAVVSEKEEAVEKEIILGLPENRTDDDEFDKQYSYGGYTVAIKGDKIVIASTYASGCYQGIEALIEKIESSSDGIFADQTFEGEGKVLKVSCVGDSITEGSNSSKPKDYTYPCYIQQMLGLDYYVYNAGVSGLSICKNDPLAYHTRPAYTNTLEMKPDIIIFGLGTNDANPKLEKYPYKNWEDPDHDRSAEFVESTQELLDSFKEANPDVQIFLIYPASLFVVADDHWRAEPWTETIVKYVRPLLEQIVGEYNLPTIDLFDWSKENSAVFKDGLHPYDESYKTLAQYIYDNIKDEIKKPQ